MIVAGIGCRRGASAPDVEAAVRAALSDANVSADALEAIATIAAKAGEPGIQAAAQNLGVPLVIVPEQDLEAANARTATRSERVVALTGLHSVAEAAALAAAGPLARLLGPRLAIGPATCALAASGTAP